MNFSELSNDELADAQRDLLLEVEARVEALPPSGLKTAVKGRLEKVHGHLNRLNALFTDEGTIQPFSGGEPKP